MALVSQLPVPSAYSNGSLNMLLMLKIKCFWKLKFVKYAVYIIMNCLSSYLVYCYDACLPIYSRRSFCSTHYRISFFRDK